METLQIQTNSKKYPLYIGENIRFNLNELISDHNYSAIMIISDENVAPLYLDEVKAGLSKPVHQYIVPGGEAAKSFKYYYDCLTYALECDLDRRSLVIAFGGGVIGDLAGFVAATYMRGIGFIQMPTTLLAHDSSVGGKVAINHPAGKNMIGAFYQPDAVIYDIGLLTSLPVKEWRSGFAEIIKHALIWDQDFYHWLTTEITTLADLKDEKLQHALQKGILVKAAVVQEDETETGIRSYLNFGHTLGHALEAELGYGKLTHGDAVAIGMLFAIRVSEDYYQTDLHLSHLKAWFSRFGYPSIPEGVNTKHLLQFMKKDKKSESGTINMVLMKRIGEVEVVSLTDDYVYRFLQEELKGGDTWNDQRGERSNNSLRKQ